MHRRSIGTQGSYTGKLRIAVYLAIACPWWHNTGAIKQLDGSTTLRDIQNEAVVASVLNSVCTMHQLARPEPAGLSTLTRTVMTTGVIACMLATFASLLGKKLRDRHIGQSL